MPKYDVTIGSERRSFRSMGQAMLHIMKDVEARGLDPMSVLPEKPNGRGPVWRVFDGTLTESQVARSLTARAPNDGRITRRWLHRKGDLFRRPAQTACLTNEWTLQKSFLPSIGVINAAMVQTDVRVEVSR